MSSDIESPARRTQDVLEAENLIETYKIIADWIRFADTKAAVTLTVNGILLGLLIPTLKTYLSDRTTVHPAPWWTALVVGLFLGWLIGLVLSAVHSFLCILPFRGLGRQLALSHTTHFHPAAVSQKFPISDIERFVGEGEQLGMGGLKREILAALLLDSHLSSAKYRFVTRSIWCMAVSVVFGFLYLLAIQF
jgi:hypothetical protein